MLVWCAVYRKIHKLRNSLLVVSTLTFQQKSSSSSLPGLVLTHCVLDWIQHSSSLLHRCLWQESILQLSFNDLCYVNEALWLIMLEQLAGIAFPFKHAAEGSFDQGGNFRITKVVDRLDRLDLLSVGLGLPFNPTLPICCVFSLSCRFYLKRAAQHLIERPHRSDCDYTELPGKECV